MAYTKTVWKDYPDTTTKMTAQKLNNIEDGIEALEDGIEASDTSLSSGWISASETWVYASVDNPTGVITISGNVTTKYSLGMRIKFTNATNVIYGIITAISYSSPNTTMKFLHEIDPTDSLALHLMANSAITANYYSNVKAPFGFPLSPDKWSVTRKSTANLEQATPTANTYYNLGSLSLAVPIGDFKISFTCSMYGYDGNENIYDQYTVLSTANNTRSDAELSHRLFSKATGATGMELSSAVYKEKQISLTSKTTYYLNSMTPRSTQNTIGVQGAWGTTVINATCAYL